MPLNASIPLAVKQVAIAPVSEVNAAVQDDRLRQQEAQMRSQQLRSNELKFQDDAEQRENVKAIHQAIQQHMTMGPDGTPMVDHKAVMQTLAQANKAQLVLDYQAQLSAMDEAQEKALSADMEREKKRDEEVARLVKGLDPADQAGWQRTLSRFARMGIDMRQMPAVLTPELQQTLVDQGTTLAEWNTFKRQVAADALAAKKEAAAAANQARDDARADEGLALTRRSVESQIADRAADNRRQDAAAKAAGGPAGVKLSAGQQTDLETMLTVADMANGAKTLGDQIKWSGVGGMWKGSASQAGAKFLGRGTPQEQSLRDKIGNIQATIAKLRGGTSFTPNEQKLLDTYTPTIDDSPKVIQQKLADINEFVELKRKNMIRIASGDYSPAAGSAPPPTGATENWVRDPATGKLRKQ